MSFLQLNENDASSMYIKHSFQLGKFVVNDEPLDVDELEESDPDDAELELDDSTFCFSLTAFRTAAPAAFFCACCSSSALNA